jgi:hypothetical protein
MSSHLLLMTLFSFLVSLVFAVLVKDEPRARLRFGAIVFVAFMCGALALGWLLYPFPL